MKKLAIVTTHPVQYYAPVFRLLAERGNIAVHVFYTLGRVPEYDRGFQKNIRWDIPLTDGYAFSFVHNDSTAPGSHHFRGAVNPGLVHDIEAYAPDAVLVYGWAYHSHLRVMKHFKGKVPVWFRGDSTLLDPVAPLKRLLRKVYLTWIYSFVDRAFYTGSANKKYFRAAGLNESQLVFAPHAIDNRRFAESRPEEAQALRTELHVKPGDLLFLFTGKLEEKKNVLFLVDCFKRLRLPGTHLLLVGDGPLESAIRARIADAPEIHLRGFVNQAQIPVYYQSCDVFCLPSAGPGESWGLAVNEAMAAGKPVLVSTRAGSAADLVDEGGNGYALDPANPRQLEALIVRCLQEKDRLPEMGRRSREMIREYSFLKQAEAFETKLNRGV